MSPKITFNNNNFAIKDNFPSRLITNYTSDIAKIDLGRSRITTRAGRIQDVVRFDETDVVNVRIESQLFRK